MIHPSYSSFFEAANKNYLLGLRGLQKQNYTYYETPPKNQAWFPSLQQWLKPLYPQVRHPHYDIETITIPKHIRDWAQARRNRRFGSSPIYKHNEYIEVPDHVFGATARKKWLDAPRYDAFDPFPTFKSFY